MSASPASLHSASCRTAHRHSGKIRGRHLVVQAQLKEPGNQPYCSNCGYVLAGLTDSSKCPECGKPIVEVLTRPTDMPNFGKRYRSKATLFGFPVIEIAVGPKNGERYGKAKGIIAIGDVATGGIAVGGMSFGVVAIGGMSIGGCTVGGLSIGVLAGLGGAAVGALAAGGGAVGALANGGGAVGIMAQGGGALGVSTRDFRGPRPLDGGAEAFDRFSWFFGAWPPGAGSTWQSMFAVAGVVLAVALVIA